MTEPRFGVAAHGLAFHKGGELHGYLYYRKVRGDGDRHHLHVTDMAASTPAAVRRVWTALRDMGTMLDSIVIPTSSVDPFQLALPDPRHGIKLYDRFMLRIADLPAAIAARGWPAQIRETLHFDVSDDVVASNAGKWTVHIENGSAVAERGGDGSVAITARGLASLYSGYASAATLALLGQLQAEPAQLHRVSAPFAGHAPWMRDHF